MFKGGVSGVSQPVGCHQAGPWLTLQLHILQRAQALATSFVQKRSEQRDGVVWLGP